MLSQVLQTTKREKTIEVKVSQMCVVVASMQRAVLWQGWNTWLTRVGRHKWLAKKFLSLATAWKVCQYCLSLFNPSMFNSSFIISVG